MGSMAEKHGFCGGAQAEFRFCQVIFEKSSSAGSFFRRFPIHRMLISHSTGGRNCSSCTAESNPPEGFGRGEPGRQLAQVAGSFSVFNASEVSP